MSSKITREEIRTKSGQHHVFRGADANNYPDSYDPNLWYFDWTKDRPYGDIPYSEGYPSRAIALREAERFEKEEKANP